MIDGLPAGVISDEEKEGEITTHDEHHGDSADPETTMTLADLLG